MKNKEYLKDRLYAAGFSLSERQYDQLMMYYEMLVEKNKVMNLTAITEFEEMCLVDKKMRKLPLMVKRFWI